MEECRFDYTREDHQLGRMPYPIIGNPKGHFQPLEESERQLDQALEKCDKKGFESAMHRMQDYYTHWKKGYRRDPGNPNWPCNGWGHACADPDPDRDAGAWAEAERKTDEWVQKWLRKCCIKLECSKKRRCQWVPRSQGPCDPGSPLPREDSGR